MSENTFPNSQPKKRKIDHDFSCEENSEIRGFSQELINQSQDIELPGNFCQYFALWTAEHCRFKNALKKVAVQKGLKSETLGLSENAKKQ